MRITLIKTATFLDEAQDIGEHELCYSLYPHEGDMKAADVHEEAYWFSQMPYVAVGKVDLSQGVVSYKENGVILETLKVAEDGNGLIMRFYEHHGEEKVVAAKFGINVNKVTKCNILEETLDQTGVTWDGENMKMLMKPYEIVTIRVEKEGAYDSSH